MPRLARLIEECGATLLGHVPPETTAAIMAYVENPSPTSDDWAAIAHRVIRPSLSFGTVWQAVLRVDPEAPKRGRTTDIDGNVLQDWPSIPAPLTVARAVKAALENP